MSINIYITASSSCLLSNRFRISPGEEFRLHMGTIKENRQHQQCPFYSYQTPMIKISKVCTYKRIFVCIKHVRIHF